MDFAQQQRNPARHIVGIVFVILFHVLLVYALINGLASRVVDAIKKPVEVKIVEEVKPPPPPPQNLPPPPKLTAPPPPFIPPPEVPIATPPPSPIATTAVAPPAQAFTPQITAPAPPAPPAPPAKNIKAVCSNSSSIVGEFPSKARKANITEGTVTVHFVVKANGEIADVTYASSNRFFTEAAAAMVSQLKCAAPGQDQPITWPLAFKLED